MASPSDTGAPSGTDLEELLQAHLVAFADQFGDGGDVRVFFSPGRVNLMGAHLDYNGGPVMPMTVHCGTILAVRERSDRRLRLATTHDGEPRELDLDALPGRALDAWVDYPLGVARELVGRAPSPKGLDLLFGGNLPIGAGLSSSASICVGTAFALDEVWELGLTAAERVRAALVAEREFVGVHCGIMDPFAVGFAKPGHLLWLDCKDERVEHLPLDPALVRIAVVDSGVRRQLAHGAFNRRVEECHRAFELLAPHAEAATCLRDVPSEVLARHGDELEPNVAKRARHVLSEVERTFLARESLLAGDLDAFGRQMTAAHLSLAKDFEVSVGELDCLVEAALGQAGVLGTRLTGAGFGGCIVVLLRAGTCDDFEEVMTRAYRRHYDRDPVVWFFAGDPGPRELASQA